MKVDFGGVVVVDRPVSGNYDICFTVANSLVLPRPLVLYTEHTLHDKSCIKDEMQYSSFPMDVRMRGTQVTSYISEGIVHIAVPDLDESVAIAKSLAIYDLLVQKRSLNSAVATYVKSRLPVITMMSSSDMVLSKTAFVFSKSISPKGFTRCFDVRRCYANALFEDRDTWAHFSCLDDIESASAVTGPGRYYITTNNYFPLKGNGWYYHTILNYCHDQEIAFEVHFAQYATNSYPSVLFQPVINDLREKLVETKHVINHFIGMLKTKVSSGIHASHFVTKSRSEALCYIKASKNSTMLFENGIYYCSPERLSQNVESSRHIYDQVIERSWISIYELNNKMKPYGSLMWVKTDSITIDTSDPDFILDSTLYREEDPSKPPVFETPDESMPFPQLVSDPIYFDIDHSWQWDEDNVCIIGRAGTAKSSILRRILLEKKNAIAVSPTNRAASAFKGGQTIHSFFGIKDVDNTKVSPKKIAWLAKTYSCVLVDEVFLCFAWMIEAFYRLKLYGVKFVLAGDPYQLPCVSGKPVNEERSTLRNICSNRFARLSKNMRSANNHTSDLMSQAVANNKLVLNGVKFCSVDLTIRCHLTFTNACASNLNDAILKLEIRKRRDIIWSWGSTIGRCSSLRDVPADAIVFTRGTPLYFVASSIYGPRNTHAVVCGFTDSKVRLEIDEKENWYKLTPEFFTIARVAYSLTIHKSQGLTIRSRYQIHEFQKIKRQKIGPRLLYVAFTRATKDNYVMCVDCKCDKLHTLRLTSR